MAAFDSSGTVIWSASLGTGFTLGNPTSFSDGSFMLAWQLPQIPDSERRVGETYRHPAALVRYAPRGDSPDTIGVFPGYESAWVETPAGTATVMTTPFGRLLRHAAHGENAYVGTGDGYEVRVYGPSGSLERIVRRVGLDLRITPAALDSFWVEWLEDEDDPMTLRHWNVIMAETPHPEERAPYGEIQVDSEGHLWISDYSVHEPSANWDVFDPQGRWLGEVTVPQGFQVFEIDEDYIVGVATDDLDVEHVRMYGLTR